MVRLGGFYLNKATLISLKNSDFPPHNVAHFVAQNGAQISTHSDPLGDTSLYLTDDISDCRLMLVDLFFGIGGNLAAGVAGSSPPNGSLRRPVNGGAA